ncbi:Minimal PKS chain-length factor (CLF/KS beta) OS=Streptomyces griseomycini OX=66895 GN=FHS37_003727 PE=3 SV=1 [Streptomyces griseomycini]
MIVGAAEAPLAPYSMVCQLGYPELSTVDDPDRAYRPFTSGACGFVPAEGGAILVVEDEDRARERGAAVRATVAGHAATFTGASREHAAHRAFLGDAPRPFFSAVTCGPSAGRSGWPTVRSSRSPAAPASAR